jgi:hypothetical protein
MSMVDQGRTAVEPDFALHQAPEPPPLDPQAIERAYRLQRARRRARVARLRERRHAGVRFWLVLIVLLAASVALAVVIVAEIQRLFGV